MSARARDDQTQIDAKAFRPNVRPAVIALCANLLLGGLCLGVPYYRGRLQAEHALDAYASFAQCLLGGRAHQAGGLGLPSGERDHFAAMAMSGDTRWPGRCRPLLARVAPAEATFLWPSVKQAGGDVRAVVELFDRELRDLAAARSEDGSTRVPTRPLLALGKLQAGLTLFARAAGTDHDLDRLALEFTEPAAIVQPARLPLTAAATATLDVSVRAGGLEAVAMDRRGISWLRLADAQLDRRRIRRTSLVRGILSGEGEQRLIVWAMPPDRCASREEGCVHRATGIARFGGGVEQLPEPTWLAGHPAVRVERALQTGLDDHLDMLALASAQGAIEVRRYALPDEPMMALASADEKDAPRPLPPTRRWSIGAATAPEDALLLPGSPRAAALALTENDETRVTEVRYEHDPASREVARVPGAQGWLDACQAGTARWLVFGTERAVGVRLADGLEQRSPVVVELALRVERDDEDPSRDSIALACDREQLVLAALTPEQALVALRCHADQCAAPARLANNVREFALVLGSEGAVAAYTLENDAQIRVAPLDSDAEPSGTQVPAACWDPSGGMCGRPTLLYDGARLLLAARDGSDLLLIESEDGGRSFRTMGGLKSGAAVNTDSSAPMDQHRLRKGLK